jgi:BirA family transcriptional regulator, biotin operon repressor / biotin---[acetyl-CoA-carboxylase] ligase
VTARAPLDLARLRAALGGQLAELEVVERCPSTNAALLARADAPEGTVLAAEFQSAGRGRLDRRWVSPPRAGLTFSVLLRPAAPVGQWGWLPLLAGVAVADAVGPTAALKWPNDLLVGARKAGGILGQVAGPAVVIGVGVNVSATAAELPEAATSLEIEADRAVDRTELLTEVLGGLMARYRRWSDAAGHAEASGLRAEYLGRCDTLDREVTVTSGAESITGRAVDIDPAGRLVVRSVGADRLVSAGDVTHVRPARPVTA